MRKYVDSNARKIVRSNDNAALYFALALICGAPLAIFGVWTIVEFVQYMVKGEPFNKWSLWLTIAAFVSEIFLIIKTINEE